MDSPTTRAFEGEQFEPKIDKAMQGFIRREKYASARIVSFRIVRELERPLAELERHIALLERIAVREPAIQPVLESLRVDRQVILDALQRLDTIEPPAESAA